VPWLAQLAAENMEQVEPSWPVCVAMALQHALALVHTLQSALPEPPVLLLEPPVLLDPPVLLVPPVPFEHCPVASSRQPVNAVQAPSTQALTLLNTSRV
jgi:hypothetical protein